MRVFLRWLVPPYFVPSGKTPVRVEPFPSDEKKLHKKTHANVQDKDSCWLLLLLLRGKSSCMPVCSSQNIGKGVPSPTPLRSPETCPICTYYPLQAITNAAEARCHTVSTIHPAYTLQPKTRRTCSKSLIPATSFCTLSASRNACA